MADFASFDDTVAGGAGTVGGIDSERTDQNITTITTPNPANLISDHSAEGADYLPAARDIPQNPPAPPMPVANHDTDGAYPAYDANANQHGNNSEPHAGNEGGNDPTVWGRNHAQPNAYGLINIGRPFVAIAQGVRHLRQNVYDSRGFNVNPADAPSAPVQIWNSQHDTEPRWIGFDVSPLFENVGKGPQFSTNPGYLGVSDNAPNRAPRQWGSQVAQMPDDPYVAQGASSGPGAVDYSWDF